MASQPRGLHNFISDIRSCQSKEEERIRVDKELANIRLKFATSSALNSYQKKKYVWKMCYIYMLGYDVDFGHMEIISLLSSTKFSEKSVGYMAVSLLLKPDDELMTLVVNSIRNDLVGNSFYGKNLALSVVANIGGTGLAEALCSDVQHLVTNPQDTPQYVNPNAMRTPEEDARNRACIRKKACLCLLRLYRTNPETVDIQDWAERFPMLLEDRDLGVATSALSLLLGFASHSPADYDFAVPFVVQILSRLVLGKTTQHDYLYYQIPAPWLQVKCIRFLQYFRPPSDPKILENLFEVLRKILNRSENTESVNKNNAEHSILFEAVNLVISYGGDAEARLREQVLILLGRFIGVKDANIRYLGLEAMSRLSRLEGPSAGQKHQAVVITSLKDADISVQKRALDLLFVLTDTTNCEEVVGELLLNLSTTDSAIKEDMVIKIAILAEKFASSLVWYLDTMVQVITVAGDFVSEDVWHRIVHIVTNHPDMHEYASEKMMGVAMSKYAHETAVALAAYILGEFGVNICEKPGMSGYEQFAALHQHFPACSLRVKPLLLTAYVKIQNVYPDCRDIILDVFRKYANSGHLELQQRACEYLRLASVGGEMMESVLDNMPAYSDSKESALLRRLGNGEDATQDRSVWKTERPDRPSGAIVEQSADEVNYAPANVAGQMDLLSLDDDYSAPVVSAEPIGLSADLVPSLRKWFNSAVLAPPAQPAMVFENEVIRVSTIAEFRAHQGRMSIVFYNKGDEITDFKAEVGEVDYLSIQRQEPSSRISIADQTKLNLAIECTQPFADAPELTISFAAGGNRYLYALRLPIIAASFFEPIVVDKAMYMARWKALEGEEAQEVFQPASTISPQLMAFLKTQCIPGLHIGIAAGLDTDTSVTGCCSFRTNRAGPDGNLIAIGALMRLEADPATNRFRITVRAKHPKIAQAIKNIIKGQLI